MSPQPDTATADAADKPGSRPIELIVVHCSATPSGKVLGGGLGDRHVSAAQVIDRWHMQRGFARNPASVAEYSPELPHIGYHWVIDLDGTVLPGRRITEVGAHCKGYNANSLGLCLVGGLEPEASYTTAQWRNLNKLVLALKKRFAAARVVGHRDLNAGRTCPGFDVQAWWALGGRPLDKQVL